MRRAWKSFEVRARRALEPGLGARRPGLEVVALRRREAHVTAAQEQDPVGQLERLEDIGHVARELLVLVVARLGRHDLDQLDLVELCTRTMPRVSRPAAPASRRYDAQYAVA